MTLVSAILPTKGRREYAQQAVDCFRKQTYPQRELVILDDDSDPSFEANRFDPQRDGILYFRHSEGLTIAEKRNRCVEAASGDILMHWDSDDWSAADRMADQVARLEISGKDVTGYHSMLFWDTDQRRAVFYRGRPLFAIGTSLTFTYDWWKRFPFKNGRNNPNVGEDGLFVKDARKNDAITTEHAGQLMVARIHIGNTSPKRFDCTSSEYSYIDNDRIPQAFFQ